MKPGPDQPAAPSSVKHEVADLWRDLTYALRIMRKRPGATGTALLTLALGLGANTAVFSVINGVLLKPLPYPDANRLIHVTIAANTGFGDRTSLPMADYLAWQFDNRSCQSLAAYTTDRVAVSGAGEAEQVARAAASAGFFETFGVQPAFGRFWRAGDDQPGAALTAIVGYGFWEEQLRAARDVIGRALMIDGRLHTVIGVAPAGFSFPSPDIQLWTIERLDPPTRRGPYFLRGVGRLKVGATIQQVRDDLVRAEAAVRKTFPSRNETHYRIEPLSELLTGDARPALMLLAGAVLLVWMIAVGNVANLLLVGAAEREREFAIRAALGAERRRLAVQLIVEGLVLAAAGAAAAWIVAMWATRALVAASPPDLPRLVDIQMDTRVLAFTIVTGIASAIVFSLAPAWHASDGMGRHSIHAGMRTSPSRAARRVQHGLIVAEIALALTVAVMAGLLVRSLVRLQHVAVGVSAEHVLTASVVPPAARYTSERVAPVFAELIQRVEAIPGVVAAGVTNSLPPDGLSLTDNFVVEGRAPSERGAPIAPLLFVSAGYFRALGIPLRRGRWFDRFDTASSAPVAIVSEAMAREHFAGVDPIGRRLKNASDPRSPNPWRTIVGVVSDVKYGGLAVAAEPSFYVPVQQVPSRDEHLVVRTVGDPSAVVRSVRDALRAMDPELPLGDVRTLDEQVWQSTGPARFRTGLMALFGAMALILAAVGVYGVIAWAVTQRTREFGVRVALGAARRDVVRLVVTETARLAGLGTAIGFVLALGASRLMSAVLYAVSPSDSLTFIGISTLLVTVALVSGLLPAWRAATTDPVIALRAE